MNRQLEQHITETLEARATTVRDLPDLGERVVTRGRRVRRRRRMYGGLAVVAAVATAVATPTVLVDRDARRTPAPPVTTPTGQLSPSSDGFLSGLPVGERTDVPFAVGSRIFTGHEQATLGIEETVHHIARVQGGYLVVAGNRPSFSVGITGDQPYRELGAGAIGSAAATSDGSAVAWTIVDTKRDLTELRTRWIRSGRVRATRELAGWLVRGWIGDEVLIEPADRPALNPQLWSPLTGSVRRLPIPSDQAAPVYVLGFQSSGDLVLTRDQSNCMNSYRLSRATTLWSTCERADFAAIDDRGRLVLTRAQRSGLHLEVREADGVLIREIDLPAPAAAATSVVWESADSFLMLVVDIAGNAQVGPGERNGLVRCRVTTGRCERVPTPEDGYITALGRL